MTRVSVVVIGRNEGARLARCLESVNAMDATGLEVERIYVDSGSTDDSALIAARAGFRAIVLEPQRPTAALGRNAGWRAAAGEFVLFLDGDTVLDAGFVQRALESMKDANVAVVWGHRREIAPEKSVYNRVLDLDWVYAPGETLFCGGDALMRRSVLKEVDGFDATLIAGEEPEMCRRIAAKGHRIVHIDAAMTRHDLAMTRFAQYWKRAVRAGHAYAEVAARMQGGDEFWGDELKRNRRHVGVLAGMFLAAVLAPIRYQSVWPIVLVAAMLSAMVLRTAWRARWKSHDWGTLVLYGVYSHLQQLPIFVGAVGYRRGSRRGERAVLMEYKA